MEVGIRGSVLIATLTAALSVASAGTASPAAPVASFRHAPGWLVVRAGDGNPSLVVAVTSADSAAVEPVALWTSFRKLSADGVLVWAETIGRGRKGFPSTSSWPPRLSSLRIERGWEGQPAARIQQRMWAASVHGWDLDIRVFFGTQRPTRALRAEAEAELGRLLLP